MHPFFETFLLDRMPRPGEPKPAEGWQIHSLKGSLKKFTGRWDALNRQVLAGHPMLDSRFVEALLRHFGDGSETLCEFEKHHTQGMCILKPGKFGMWTSFLPPQTQLAPAILSPAANLASLPLGLPGLAWQIDLLCQDPAFSPALACREIPCHAMPHVLTMNIRLEGGFDAYWQKRSSNLRRSLRARANRVARSGLQPRLVRLQAPTDMHRAVERFGKLERTGWKGRAGTAVGIDNAQGRFYSEMLASFAACGQAAVYEYWLGERLAAAELTINNEHMMILLKTAYDEGLADFAPGRLLLRDLIRDAFSRFPGGAIEFYTNASSDELAWATGQRWIQHISLYRNQIVEHLLATVSVARHLGRPRPRPKLAELQAPSV